MNKCIKWYIFFNVCLRGRKVLFFFSWRKTLINSSLTLTIRVNSIYIYIRNKTAKNLLQIGEEKNLVLIQFITIHIRKEKKNTKKSEST